MPVGAVDEGHDCGLDIVAVDLAIGLAVVECDCAMAVDVVDLIVLGMLVGIVAEFDGTSLYVCLMCCKLNIVAE